MSRLHCVDCGLGCQRHGVNQILGLRLSPSPEAFRRPHRILRWPLVRSSAFRARPGGVRQIYLILVTAGVVLEAVARPVRESRRVLGQTREGLEKGGEKELEAVVV
jgi:hypothetical protein